MKSTAMATTTKMSALPWELLVDLVSKFLDPDSLAMASCVCKSWNSSISSDHLWRCLLLTHFPSSLHLTTPETTYRQIFSLLYSSSNRRKRIGRSPPRLALRQLVFTIDVFRSGDPSPIISIAKRGEDLGDGGIVRVDIRPEKEVVVEVGEKLRVVWMVVMKGWEGAFSVMEREGKGRLVEGDGLWFSEELPAGPGHCPYFGGGGGGGLVAELGLGFRWGFGRLMRVEKVSLGLMSVVEWRYVSVEDGLLYLQQFLLPPSF